VKLTYELFVAYFELSGKMLGSGELSGPFSGQTRDNEFYDILAKTRSVARSLRPPERSEQHVVRQQAALLSFPSYLHLGKTKIRTGMDLKSYGLFAFN
jgi:hypothetical protein